MKMQLYPCLIAAALLAAGSMQAQTRPTTAPAPAPASSAAATADEPEFIELNGQRYALISSIKTIAANKEFQDNINIVQQQRNILIDFHRRKEAAFTTPEKEALQQRIDEMLKKLDENNATMAKVYGFSLLRNYLLQIIKSRVLLQLTDSEYNQLTEAERNAPDAISTRTIKDKDGKDVTIRLKYVATISGIAENDIFRQELKLINDHRQNINQLKQALTQIRNEGDKKKLDDAIKKGTEELQKVSDELLKKYRFNLQRDYAIDVEESRLYTAVTEEEIKKAAEAKANPSAAPAAATPAPAPAATAPAPAAKPAGGSTWPSRR
ncbi:MAG: hypothetical protein LBV54_01195 [Puniceicoccales bacterium]|jgi:hypothetical protein|nr:hypothetical protein [Puniceicoccales bacterium]